ncbi:MAG: NUDIX domain-containing protein [Bauldia sp.]
MKAWQRFVVSAGATARRLGNGLTLGVRVAAFDSAGQVYLVRHRHLPGWYLPGGAVEPGESAAAAATREVAEEAAISAARLDLFGLYFNAHLNRRDHVALFLCREWTRLPNPRPSVEIAEGGFFSRRELPDGVTDATVRRLAEILDGRSLTEEW